LTSLSASLETIDPATRGWLERKRFDVPDLDALALALNLDEIELNRIYELEPADMVYIEREHGTSFDDESLPVVMVIDHGTEHQKYDEQASHTGRELLLMLAGKKPLAVFSKIDGPEEDGIVPEELFDPYVQSGRFTKLDEVVEMTRFGPMRRIYYAAAGEEWRIEAFRTLWRLGEKHKSWSDGFEKMEGYLLGYEADIDPFFK
jgi:hypothetical protein